MMKIKSNLKEEKEFNQVGFVGNYMILPIGITLELVQRAPTENGPCITAGNPFRIRSLEMQ